MIKLSANRIALILIGLILVALIVIQYLATGVSGETDSIYHYQLARYAFENPENFLSHWGKPLFTTLSAPFAQFGYTGSMVFNWLAGLASAWFAFGISKKLGYKHSWAAVVFTIFTPIYLFIMYTSLTEILFSLVLIASIYLFISERYILSAIVISLIPFARSEGMMYVVLFLLALIWMRQYKSLPFLLSGFVLFSLIGLPVYHDFFWYFTHMPYSNSNDIYGSGSFWFYFKRMDSIMNYPMIILGVTGLILIFSRIKQYHNQLHNPKFIALYILVIPSFLGFILVQSFLWWQGMMAVLGSTRFMACVMPLSAILATAGFDFIMEKTKVNRWIYTVMGIFILAMVVYKPFTYHKLPMKSGLNLGVMKKLTDWLKESPYANRRAFYTDPAFPFYMDISPFDQTKCFKIYNYPSINLNSYMKSGDLLIWDAQFAGFEGKLPFDSVMNKNYLQLANIFTPDEGFKIIGGEQYRLAVFIKAPKDTTKAKFKSFYFNDYENDTIKNHAKHFVSTQSYSKTKSIRLHSENVYSISAEGKLSELPGFSNFYMRASVKVKIPDAADKGKVLLVISVDGPDNKNYRYLVSKDSDQDYKAGDWIEITRTDMIERNVPANGKYKVYVWYTGKGEVFVDDLKLEYMLVGN